MIINYNFGSTMCQHKSAMQNEGCKKSMNYSIIYKAKCEIDKVTDNNAIIGMICDIIILERSSWRKIQLVFPCILDVIVPATIPLKCKLPSSNSAF